MTIPASARPSTPSAANRAVNIVDPETGNLTSNGINVLSDMLNYYIGSSRVIPCEETGTNILALTQLSISPLIKQYNDYDIYQFVAAATSTGLVTANVTLVSGAVVQGTLATLKVFKSNGATQATVGDVVLGSQYELTYVDSLNSGAGGFVLR
jgi:hypothetical protein